MCKGEDKNPPQMERTFQNINVTISLVREFLFISKK